jgi:hypothetical protein
MVYTKKGYRCQILKIRRRFVHMALKRPESAAMAGTLPRTPFFPQQ